MLRLLLVAGVAVLCATAPAEAGPVATAVAAVAKVFGAGGALAAGTFAGTIARLAVSLAASAVSRRLAERKLAKQRAEARGVRSEFTSSGGLEPLTFVVGRYATRGRLVAPPMSRPWGSGQSADWLTHVIALSDVPGVRLLRVAVDGRWVDLDGSGNPVQGPLNGLFNLAFWDGHQTVADPFLIAEFGADPERPWQPDMVGRATSYVRTICRFDDQAWRGDPQFLFELAGVPLYDPRLDSTVGGSGPQRWADPTSWAFTANPKVIHYNILRGITVPGHGVWGGRVRPEDLPLDVWFAAMNACDLTVQGPAGPEPAFRFGYEISVADEPAEICELIDRCCRGQTAEIGGVWKTRAGGAGLPVFFFTDDDVLVSQPQELDPFRPLDAVANALTAAWVDPDLLWEGRSTPPLSSPAFELADGLLEHDGTGWVRRPRRLLRELALPGVIHRGQADRVVAAEHRDLRRDLTHELTLPPEAIALEPLDVVSWTSVRNGYTGNLFEVVSTAQPTRVLRARVGLREVDPNDDAFDPAQYLTAAAASVTPQRDLPDLAAPGAPTPTERLYVTRSGAFQVAVDLIAAPSASAAVAAYRWQRLANGVWLDEALTAEPRAELLDVVPGPLSVRVRAETAGRVSAWVATETMTIGAAAPPAAVPSARVESAGGLAVVSWDLHSDVDVRQGGRILVRHSSAVPPTWDTSTPWAEVSGSATLAVRGLLPGAYLVRALDAGGRPGPVTVLPTSGATALAFVALDLLQEDDDFAGTRDGTAVVGGRLQLAGAGRFRDLPDVRAAPSFRYTPGVVAAGTYQFATGLDLASVRSVRVRREIDLVSAPVTDRFRNRPGRLRDWDTFRGAGGTEGTAWVEVRATDDDPAGSPAWTSWMRIDAAELRCRALQARAILTTTDTSRTPRLSRLRLHIDGVSP